jgi:hypothetical protein
MGQAENLGGMTGRCLVWGRAAATSGRGLEGETGLNVRLALCDDQLSGRSRHGLEFATDHDFLEKKEVFA